MYIIEPRQEKILFLNINVCENEDTDPRAADHRLCFRFIDRTLPLLHKSEITSLLSSAVVMQLGVGVTLCGSTRLVLDPVGNLEERFSRDGHMDKC